jgi:hypothetical protein
MLWMMCELFCVVDSFVLMVACGVCDEVFWIIT